MNLGSRVFAERTAQKQSQQWLADRVTRLGYKISQSGIDRIEKRDSERPRCMPELAKALGVNEPWLLTGKGAKASTAKAQEALQVPILSNVQAGPLVSGDVSQIEIGNITVSGLDPSGDWIALRVEGDSMDRISPPGSVIVLNRKEKQLHPNACYVISDEDGRATYKRYRPHPPRFEPVSTNTSHEPIFPHNDPMIIGRVRRTIMEM